MIHVGSSKSVNRTQFVDPVGVGAVLLDTIMVVDDAMAISANAIGDATVVDDKAEEAASAVDVASTPQVGAISSSAATRNRAYMG